MTQKYSSSCTARARKCAATERRLTGALRRRRHNSLADRSPCYCYYTPTPRLEGRPRRTLPTYVQYKNKIKSRVETAATRGHSVCHLRASRPTTTTPDAAGRTLVCIYPIAGNTSYSSLLAPIVCPAPAILVTALHCSFSSPPRPRRTLVHAKAPPRHLFVLAPGGIRLSFSGQLG